MKIRRKLVIDVTYTHVRDEEDIKQIELNLNHIASHAMGTGLVTSGVDHVEVDTHRVFIEELQPEPEKETFTPLENETGSQKEFRLDMEKAGIKVTRYSGRGMNGGETYAVACRGPREIAEGATDGPEERDVFRATLVKVRRDSLGLGTILYV